MGGPKLGIHKLPCRFCTTFIYGLVVSVRRATFCRGVLHTKSFRFIPYARGMKKNVLELNGIRKNYIEVGVHVWE